MMRRGRKRRVRVRSSSIIIAPLLCTSAALAEAHGSWSTCCTFSRAHRRQGWTFLDRSSKDAIVASSFRDVCIVPRTSKQRCAALSRVFAIAPGGGGGRHDDNAQLADENVTCIPDDPTSTTAQLDRLSTGILHCLQQLGATNSTNNTVSCISEKVQQMASLISDSMSAPSRTFHTVQHVFDISHGMTDPIQLLAAYFHDLVYAVVDGGVSDAQAALLRGVIEFDGGSSGSGCSYDNIDDFSVRLCDAEELDPVIQMVMTIFGFEPRQRLYPNKGMNEFLSAAIVVNCLGDVLPPQQLFRIAACIEATIPFRGCDENGISAAEALYNRLVQTRDSHAVLLWGLTDQDLEIATQKAIGVANRDVGNFAGDPSTFLCNTWKLLPELNVALRKTDDGGGTCQISDYALALSRMTGFLAWLDATVVFQQFRGHPSDEEYSRLIAATRQTLEIGNKYMNAKLLALSVLAALAELTGGDAPLSHFVGGGSLNADGQESHRIGDYIKVEAPKQGVEVDDTVFRILLDGRGDPNRGTSTFDSRTSPLAAYLYGAIGDDGVERSLKHVVHPMNTTNSQALLRSLPRNVVNEVVTACSKVATTRSEKLQKLAGNY